MARKLKEKQLEFCRQYIVDLNATQAAIRAGYSVNGAAVTGTKLLRNANIRLYIKSLMDKRSQRTEITADMVLQELAKIAFANAKDYFKWNEFSVELVPSESLSEDQAAVVSEVSQVTTKEGGSIKIKLHDKISALDKVAKHLGMYTENLNLSGGVDVNATIDVNDKTALGHFYEKYADRLKPQGDDDEDED